MKKHFYDWASITFFILKVTTLAGKPTTFDCRDPLDRQLVQWTFEGSLQKVVAVNSAVRGFIEVDLPDINKVNGKLELDSRLFRSTSQSTESYLRDVVFKASEFPLWTVEIDAKKNIVVAPIVKGNRKQKVDPLSVIPKLEGIVQILASGLNQMLKPLLQVSYLPKGPQTQNRMDGNLIHLKIDAELDLPSLFKENSRVLNDKQWVIGKISIDITCFDAPVPVEGTIEPVLISK